MKKKKNMVMKKSKFVVGLLFLFWLIATWYYCTKGSSPTHVKCIVVCVGTCILLFASLSFRKKTNFNIDFDSLEGLMFEKYCAALLYANGYKDVRVTQGSGDHGIDVLATYRGKKYAIQCKRYKNTVGNRAVQEAYAGKGIYKADIAVVMTNNYFTKQAQEEASALNVLLWDRGQILKFIQTAK